MTRSEMVEILSSELDGVENLFALKNESCGASDDAFHNFRSTAKRILGGDSHMHMFQVLLTYMDKHMVALANRGITERECKERLRDIIVYSLIGIAMVEGLAE